MKLIEMAQHYNLIVRQSDNQQKITPEQDIVQFKNLNSRNALERVLNSYQTKLDNDDALTIEDIANLAKDIVNSQNFTDGNHRTALLICYHLCLFNNHQLLRIRPYLLYASIDFEYLKNQHALEKTALFFSNNAIHSSLLSRAIGKVYSPTLKMIHMEMIINSVKILPIFLNNLAKNIIQPHINSFTIQDRLFRTFGGYRPHNEHSSMVSVQSYRQSIFRQKLDTKPFSPTELIEANLFKSAI